MNSHSASSLKHTADEPAAARRLLLLAAFAICSQACVHAQSDAPRVPATQPNAAQPAAPTPASSPAEAELDELARLVTGNNTPDARLLGARKLLENGSDAAVERITEVLRGASDPLAKRTICEAIADSFAAGANGQSTPPRGLLAPVADLLGTQPELNDLVVHALRRFSTDAVIETLRAVALDTTATEQKRHAAVAALGTMGDDLRAVGALVGLLDVNPIVPPPIVLEALSEATGVRHIDAAAAVSWWQGRKSMKPLQWLREVNERRIDETRRLRGEMDDLTRRLVAASREAYLRSSEAQQPDRLMEFLDDQLFSIRHLGLELINARITDRKEIAPQIRTRLLDLLIDADARIRRAAALLIGDVRPPRATDQLIDALAREEQPAVRAAEAVALGRLDEPAVISALVQALDDPAPEVVSEAAWSLGMLTRPGRAAQEPTDRVVDALHSRFDRIPAADEALRAKFLEAMAQIGAEAFSSIYSQVLDASESPKLRAAAIAGLAGLRDPAAAMEIRRWAGDADAQVRMAVVQALHRCGEAPQDLSILERRMNAAEEPDPIVRERAWDAYLKLSETSSAGLILESAERFLSLGDAAWTGRALALLQSIQKPREQFASLPVQKRRRFAEALAAAQYELQDYEAARRTLETALADDDENEDLHLRLAACLLRQGEDSAALEQLRAAAAVGEDAALVRQTLLHQLRLRLDEAASPTRFAALLSLIDLAARSADEVFPAPMSAAVRTELAAFREESLQKRHGLIDRLVADAGRDQETTEKLIAFGPALVLPAVHHRLVGTDAASGPAVDEAALVALARRLAPDWAGYDPSDAAARSAALDELEKIVSELSTAPPQ